MRRRFFTLFASIPLLVLLLTAGLLRAQAIPRMDTVRIVENGNLLRNPDAGGFNVPEFSAIDLDGDGIQDLFAFDRSGRKVVTFLNGGTPGQIDYHFAPNYVDAFPAGITDFALCTDYDCDGKADLFFGTNAGIKVYHNTSTPGNLSFTLYKDTLLTNYGAGPALIYLYQGDLPAFVDLDHDSDLDVLAFNTGGTSIEWHKNMVFENTGSCNGLDMEVAERCWGFVEESGLNQALTLGVTCRTSNETPIPGRPSAHSGSTISAFDEEADGDYEIVIGDLVYDGLSYCHNAGTATAANIDSVDATYPSTDASVELDIFAAAFFLDVNNDSKLDMIAAPNGTNISVNYDNSWYYNNFNPGNGVTLTRESKNFLTNEMIDVGMGAYPVFWDYDRDGLLDLVIGNYSRKISNSNILTSLVLYRNTGTATAPTFTLVNRDLGSLAASLPVDTRAFVPTFGDLDGDGDDDLIIGDDGGKLHFFRNTAPTGQLPTFTLIGQDYMGIDVGQFATPQLIDIDRDGLLDLICGEQSGTLNYFRNTGTSQVALFNSAPTDGMWGNVDVQPICCLGYSVPFVFHNPFSGQYDLIVGSEEGDLFYYNDVESEFGGSFTLDQANFGEMEEGGRTAIAGRDLDGDGIWDWTVGNLRGGLGWYSGNGLLLGANATHPDIAAGWEAYPNPTTGRLQVHCAKPSTGLIELSLTDLQGRSVGIVGQGSAAQKMELDLSHLAAGVYLLHMDINGQFAGVKRIDLVK